MSGDKDPNGDYKSLLKAAEKTIVDLQAENQALQADLNSVLEAQALETQQLVQMNEQLWKLEEALMSTTEEKEAALMLLSNLKSDVQRLKTFADQALTGVKQRNTSRLGMAVQVFEVRSMIEELGLTKIDKKS